MDSCQYKTYLVARVPRVKCPEHGLKTVAVPWADKSSRFTILFERFAIDVLLTTQTVSGAKQLLRTTGDEAWHFLERTVRRARGRKQAGPLRRIGIQRITNGVAEGLNSTIMSIKRRVGGFRNREYSRTAIFFYCGGLDLYPG